MKTIKVSLIRHFIISRLFSLSRNPAPTYLLLCGMPDAQLRDGEHKCPPAACGLHASAVVAGSQDSQLVLCSIMLRNT